ncbi:MAG: Enoyl-CoA hydratase/isomerase family protein [Myxococcaceae bacterium]|nr:Enoyl-CoA hydratase/isomerase family protein [Myxococcaceae bacterium]
MAKDAGTTEQAERVRVEVDGGIARLTLTRGDKHNGVDVAMLHAVLRAQKLLKKRRDVRAVIVHGEGPSFCAGIDAKAMTATPLRAALMLSQLLWPLRNQFQSWSMGFRELGVPVIAAIHGNCFGAGIQLALGADIRIATPDSQISIMEARLGLVPDMGGPTLLRELVRIDVAKELTLTGRIIRGSEAFELGLVSHVSDDPLAHAHSLAREIAVRSPDTVAAGKFLLQRAWGASTRTALAHERSYQLSVIGRKNQRHAMAQSQTKKRASTPASASNGFTPRRIES